MRKPFDANAIIQKLAREKPRKGDFRIAVDGSWYHKGGKIERRPMVSLFASILHRSADGRHFLVTPYEQHEVEVEEAALVVIDVDRVDKMLIATASTGEVVNLSVGNGLSMRSLHGQKVPYIEWHRGLEARLDRNAWYRLVDLAYEEDGKLFVNSDGTRFELGCIA